jgi:hypothetical protein
MAMHHLVASDIYIEIERITYMAYKKNCAFLGFFFGIYLQGMKTKFFYLYSFPSILTT